MTAAPGTAGLRHHGPVGDPQPARIEPAEEEGGVHDLLSSRAEPRQQTAWFVPGRIEVLGKHTDYAGGRSLLAAVDRGHTVTARGREDRLIVVTSGAAEDEVVLDLDDPGSRREDDGSGHWGGYVRTVVERLDANFPGRLVGSDITITSTLPLAAGMSSSSALVVGLALALIDLTGIAAEPAFRAAITTPEQLGEYLGTVENGQTYGSLGGHRGVGTFGGSEDHTSMLCGRADALVQYSFCPVRHERTVPFPQDLALVVAVSGIDAAKTGAARDAYNRVSLAAWELIDRWRVDTGRRDDRVLADALASGPAARRRLVEYAGDDAYLRGRLEQFIAESERLVPAAAIALEEGDLEELGRLVDESQRGAEDGLGNQVPETVDLKRTARELGAHAASAFGAGFGGSVWALVPTETAEQFAQQWLDLYRTRHPHAAGRASVLVTRPGSCAHRVDLQAG